MTARRFSIGGWRFLSVLALPLVLALTLDTVPRFVYAACSYYSCGSGTTVQIQARVNGGNWASDFLTIYGSANQSVSVELRTVLLVTSGQLQGWSYSVKHNTSALQTAGGSLAVYSVGPASDLTTLAPWKQFTALRTNGQGSTLGFIQGVVVDDLDPADPPDRTLGPTQGFVTSQATYNLILPTQSSWVTFNLVDDIGDGRPPIRTRAVAAQQGFTPCRCGLTLNLSVP